VEVAGRQPQFGPSAMALALKLNQERPRLLKCEPPPGISGIARTHDTHNSPFAFRPHQRTYPWSGPCRRVILMSWWPFPCLLPFLSNWTTLSNAIAACPFPDERGAIWLKCRANEARRRRREGEEATSCCGGKKKIFPRLCDVWLSSCDVRVREVSFAAQLVPNR
jgi:hypothetical protein